MKNAFYFTLKTLSVFKIFKFLSWLFNHAEKRLDQKVSFKIYDATAWLRKKQTKTEKNKGTEAIVKG